jgi:hypothetical protein
MSVPRALNLTAALATLAAASYVVWLHVDSARLLTHTVGVFALLAELLRHGVLYPHAPTDDLVYSVFYHPLGFAPYALLPGSGLDLIAGMRVLVGAETLGCAVLLAFLWLRQRGGTRLLPGMLALCTVPVAFSLIGMRDDPRALLFSLLALFAFGGEAGRPARPILAGALLTLAFFVKATAPLAPGVALLCAALGQPAGARRSAARLLGTCLLATAASVVFLQVGLDCDFLGNGLHYLLVDPARAPRSWSEALSALGSDLCAYRAGSPQPLDLATPLILTLSTLALLVRAGRRRLDRTDALVLAVWLKTVVAYRSWGTDLNHLLDLVAFASLHVARAYAPWLTSVRSLSLVAIALGLGQPWRRLLPEPGTPTLAQSPLAAAAAALRQQEPLATLCEEPLLGWLAGCRPTATDPFLTFAALRRAPEVRARWFGPADHPGALRRLVLMHDPNSADPYVEHWYTRLHFDAEFLAEVRRNWQPAIVTPTATVLVRK